MSHPCHAWYRVMFQGAKTHLVPGFLREPLIADLAQRGCPTQDLSDRGGPEYAAVKRVTSYGLDMGGPTTMGLPWPGLRVDNLDLSFPCDQWRTIHAYPVDTQRTRC